MGPKMGPSFGRTLRIVLKPDSEAQFWGTKNGPKNETQNRVTNRFFLAKIYETSAQGIPSMFSPGPRLLGAGGLQELQLASVSEGHSALHF